MLHNVQRALIVTRREVRDQFRDWRIILPILVLTLFFPALMNFTAEQVVNYVSKYDAALIGDRLIPYLLLVVGFFPISVSLVIALESFVGEKERRSIEPLLTSPMTDLQLYFGKLFAVIIPPLGASFLGILVYLQGVYRQVGWTPEPILLIQVVILTAVQALLMVSGAVVISVQATSSRAANLLASFIIVPMSILLIGESMVMFWARYNILWWAIFGQLIITSLLMRTGIAYFNREDLLGREIDTLNLRGGWGTFWHAFIGGAESVRAWYRQTFRSTLKSIRLPVLILAGLLIAAALWGAWQSQTYQLPTQAFDWSDLESGFVEGVDVTGLETIRFFSVSGIGVIWLHNLRVLALATVLALFSFGVLGVLVLMLPFVIIGYFMATAAHIGLSPLTLFAAFVLPHGILEIPAIILAGGAALRLGATLSAPAKKGHSIGDALLIALAEWLRIMVAFAIPMLFFAAILEIFVTPQIAIWMLGQ